MPYELRYCAFVDILGFRNLLRTMAAEQIRRVLSSVRELPLGREAIAFGGSDLKFHSFSDNICVSSKANLEGLSHILHSLEALAVTLLDDGTLLRGAIVKGNLHHDVELVFGEALVRAYELESTVCIHPRIMLTREVATDAQALRTRLTEDFVSEFIKQADDGPFFLNVLVGIRSYMASDDLELRQSYIARYNAMAHHLQQRFDAAVDAPRHFEKVQWFARFWNDTVRPYAGLIDKVNGPGVDPPVAVWG